MSPLGCELRKGCSACLRSVVPAPGLDGSGVIANRLLAGPFAVSPTGLLDQRQLWPSRGEAS